MNSGTLPEYSISIPPPPTTPTSSSSHALTNTASNGNQPYSVDKAFAANARKASHGQPPIRNLVLNIPPADPMVRKIIRGEPPKLKSKSKKRRKRSSPTTNSNSNDGKHAQKVQDLKNKLESAKAAFEAAQYQEKEIQSSIERLTQQRDENVLGIKKTITVASICLEGNEEEQGTDDKDWHAPQSEAEKEIIKQQKILQEKLDTLTKEFEQRNEIYKRKEQEWEQNRKRRLENEKEQAQTRKRKLEILMKELDELDNMKDEKETNNDEEKEEGEEKEDSSNMSENAALLQSKRVAKELEVSSNCSPIISLNQNSFTFQTNLSFVFFYHKKG